MEVRNLVFTIRFVGTHYSGFQVQANAPSISAAFQDALEKTIGERGEIKGCSRTDSGVHANGFCLSVKTRAAIPTDRLVLALNSHLPIDIAATDCRQLPDDFHARYSATGKEYVYKLLNSRLRDPFLEGFSHRIPTRLDETLMHLQAQDFLGRHDFSAFMASGGNKQDTIRTVSYFSVERQGEIITFTVRGDGFLYKMVRIMVGTLVEIGRGKLAAGCIPEIIKSGERGRAGLTAPAKGLYLNRVFY